MHSARQSVLQLACPYLCSLLESANQSKLPTRSTFSCQLLLMQLPQMANAHSVCQGRRSGWQRRRCGARWRACSSRRCTRAPPSSSCYRWEYQGHKTLNPEILSYWMTAHSMPFSRAMCRREPWQRLRPQSHNTQQAGSGQVLPLPVSAMQSGMCLLSLARRAFCTVSRRLVAPMARACQTANHACMSVASLHRCCETARVAWCRNSE